MSWQLVRGELILLIATNAVIDSILTVLVPTVRLNHVHDISLLFFERGIKARLKKAFKVLLRVTYCEA